MYHKLFVLFLFVFIRIILYIESKNEVAKCSSEICQRKLQGFVLLLSEFIRKASMYLFGSHALCKALLQFTPVCLGSQFCVNSVRHPLIKGIFFLRLVEWSCDGEVKKDKNANVKFSFFYLKCICTTCHFS